MDVASLSVGIDGNLSGFERVIGRATGLLSQFEARGATAGRAFDNGFGASVTRTTRTVGNSIDQLNNRISLLTQRRNLSIDTSAIARTNQEIAGLQARVNQLQGAGLPGPSSGAASGLLAYAGGLFSIGAAIGAVRAGFSIIQDFDRLDRKLQGATETQEAYNRGVNITRTLADRYGLSIQSLSNSYANLTASSQGTSLAGKETDRIFAAITARAAKLGLSADQTEGSLLAVAQMMSKGTVAAEELRGQLGERMPGAFNAMARALGVTTEQLGKMLESGSVLAEDALPKLATELLRMSSGAERNAESISGGFQRARDQVSLFIAEFSKSAGIDSFFAKFANGLANVFAGLNKAKQQTGSYFGTFQTFDSKFQGKLDNFQNLDTPQRQRAFDRNRRSLRSNESAQQAILNGSDPYSEASTSELKRLDAEKRDLLIKQREFQKIARADGAGAGSPKTGQSLDPVKYLESIKKEQKLLADTRAGLRAQGKDLDTTRLNRLEQLNAQLKRAEPDKGPKNSPLSVDSGKYFSTLDVVNRKLAELKKRAIDIRLSGKVVPDEVYNEIESLTKQVENAGNVFDRLKLTGDIRQLAINGGGSVKQSGKFASSNGGSTSLIGVLGVKKLGIDTEQAQLNIANNLLARRLSERKDILDRFNVDLQSTLEQGAATGIAGMAEVIGGLIAGTSGIEALPQALLSTLGDVLEQLGKMAIAVGIGITGINAALKTLNPVLAIAAGVGLVALGALAKSGAASIGNKARPFATGGFVSGPGSGVSDSIDAKLSNGEFVLRAAAVKGIGVQNLNRMNRYGALPATSGGYSPLSFASPSVNIPTYRAPNVNGGQRESRIEVQIKGNLRGNDQELQMARTARQRSLLGRD